MFVYISRWVCGYNVYLRDEDGNKRGYHYMDYTKKQAMAQFRADMNLKGKHINWIDV